MKRLMLLSMAMVFASTTAMATESGSWITASVGGGGNWFGITGDDAIPADTDYVVTWEYFADTWTDDGGGMSMTGAPNGTQNVITRIDDGGTAKLVIGAETGDSGNIANGIDITGVQVTVRVSLTGTTHVTEYSLDGGSYVNATTNTIAPEVGDLGAYVW